MMTKSASSTSAALIVADESFNLTESQIFAVLPNPVFVLDVENRFIYLTGIVYFIYISKRVNTVSSNSIFIFYLWFKFFKVMIIIQSW